MPLRFAEKAAQAHDYQLTIRQLLTSALIAAGDRRIVYRDQESYTYPQLAARIGRLASVLSDLGVEAGTTVAVMDWDSHRYLEAYFAVPMMGAVLQTVNVRLPAAQIAFTLRHADAEVFLVHRDFFPIVEAILPDLPRIRSVIAIMDGAGDALPAFAKGEFETLIADASPDYPFEDFDENAVATTFYTTGTTGDPKGVCFTHRQIVLHSLGVHGSVNFGRDDVYMPLTPMFHVHAWGMPYVATMLGMQQVYPGRYEPEMICALRREHGVSFSHCVPTILQMILQAADQTGSSLTGWKIVIGGSALSKALCEEGLRRGMEVVSAYGMSETCPLICVARARAGETDVPEIVSAWTASGEISPLVDARIVDEDMNELPRDGRTRGELVLRAPWLSPCYTGNPAASDALWHGGWLHTQDIATIDGRGTVVIRDRIKDVIKTGGEWIDSIQLEDLVACVDGVAAVSVIAVPDARWGERPLAVIVAAPGASVTLEGLNRPIETAIEGGALTRYARFERFELVDALPRTSVGKIDKKVLRSRFIPV